MMMKRNGALLIAALIGLQMGTALAGPVTQPPQPTGKTTTAVTAEKTTPAWVYGALRDLAAVKLVVLPAEGTAKLSRDAIALLAARASVAIEAAEAQAPAVTGGDYQATLDELGRTTKALAKLEELERRTPGELARYQQEYEKAEKELDAWADRTAAAEISASSSEGAEQVALKYKEALQTFGRVTKKLAQAETGRQDRQAYIKQLKERKTELFAQLRSCAQALAKEDMPHATAERRSVYSAEVKKKVKELQSEFAEELRNMGYGEAVGAAKWAVKE